MAEKPSTWVILYRRKIMATAKQEKTGEKQKIQGMWGCRKTGESAAFIQKIKNRMSRPRAALKVLTDGLFRHHGKRQHWEAGRSRERNVLLRI